MASVKPSQDPKNFSALASVEAVAFPIAVTILVIPYNAAVASAVQPNDAARPLAAVANVVVLIAAAFAPEVRRFALLVDPEDNARVTEAGGLPVLHVPTKEDAPQLLQWSVR